MIKSFILSDWFTLLVLVFSLFVGFGLEYISNLIIEIIVLIIGAWILGAHIYRLAIKWGKEGAEE